jgi:Subtilase family/FG-GAP-like repeat
VVRTLSAVLTVAVCAVASAAPAQAAFPWLPSGGDPHDYSTYRSDRAPDDLTGNVEWMYAATPDTTTDPLVLANNADPHELGGVRGAHIVDKDPAAKTAWQVTTGRPDVTIAVLDSGIEWNNDAAMENVRLKARPNIGELPKPLHDRATSLEPGQDCATYHDDYDANGDGVVNVVDWSCDSRVSKDPPHGVNPRLLDPQDLIIAFSDGTDADHNGFVDDIVGWDFLDDDNDPYDDVQYGHGTGEAQDSTGEAGNGGSLGTCPNCTVIFLRVGDSFVADVNDFAQAVLYATDAGASVVQEALGALNNSSLARHAVDYAYDHGVTVIASAADEAAQHHHWPESYPHVIVVNSVTKYDPTLTPSSRSYLQFNGCTNFSSKITVAIPSVSCSSDATGRGSGIAGLIYSAALNARHAGTLDDHPTSTCRRVNGDPCVITPNEVRQVMASGVIAGKPVADDVSWTTGSETSCTQAPLPSCTDPTLNAPGDWLMPSPLATTRRYPARDGFDQFYGYGRVNVRSAVDAVTAGALPPEVEITSPEWFAQVDPTDPAAAVVKGQVQARAAGSYTCRVLIAPGSYPNDATTKASPPGDFKPVPSDWCDGTPRTSDFNGTLAALDLNDLESRFPATTQSTSFAGRETGAAGAESANGRPASEPYGFTVKVMAWAVAGGRQTIGQDRRNLYLHRDQDMLDAHWPLHLPSDGASSPLFVDLDGDNRNELVLATSDGVVHAYRRDGSELPGWPVHGDRLPLHLGEPAFRSGAVSDDAGGAILASVASGDLDGDGAPEIVAADLTGHVYAWNAEGRRVFSEEANPKWSGKPLEPFVNVRQGKRNRTQHGFLASPVIADLDGDGTPEIVAAGMDRHLYAWHPDGSAVRGFPVLLVDRTKVASVDPETHAVTFNAAAGPELNQGAVIDTPAVGDITGDGKPEIVVGTNEEYAAGSDGGLNAGVVDTTTLTALSNSGLLKMANGRLYAVKAAGEDAPGGPFVTGWPVKVPRLFAELLPVVGEGVTGAPAIAPIGDCPNGVPGGKVGAVPDGGPALVLNGDGSSCLGSDGGKPRAMQTDLSGAPGQQRDLPAFPAVGHPAFGRLGDRTALVAPATGLMRALDLTANEYQGGQDFLAAWDPTTGQYRVGWPAPVNDLQFLTGPSIADIAGDHQQEVLGGTAYEDLQALDTFGQPLSAKWPKLTSDWMVANPLVGTFGTLDDHGASTKVVVALTRAGTVFAYKTDKAGCIPDSWPRFHHDNANSGDLRRDAVLPGRPMDLGVADGALAFRAPGDDLLCGLVAKYQVRVGDAGAWTDVANVDIAKPGFAQTVPLPAGVHGGDAVSIRGVDEAGQVGRPASVRLAGGDDGSGPGDGGGDGSGGDGGNGNSDQQGGSASASGTPTRMSAPSTSKPGVGKRRATRGCRPPASVGSVRAGRRSVRIGGRAGSSHCRARRTEVSIAIRAPHGRCRYLLADGTLTGARSCAHLAFVPVTGTGTWHVTIDRRLPRGSYRIVARAYDRAGAAGPLTHARRLLVR